MVFLHFVSLYPSVATASAAYPTQDNVRYVGAISCQSSMCHGGASPSRNQFTIWSQQDFHSRAAATLITARSQRIAQSLGIASASTSNRCTTCHAPLADIPSDHLGSNATPAEGVSCENCHNSAAAWLRGHTRPDWSYLNRVNAGMRDLRSALVRANTCVACHQVIEPNLIEAGHPELTFELDGQSASEPRHWREKADWFGPKAWLVGQAAALRDISRQLANENIDDKTLAAQQRALVWLLQQVPGVRASANATLAPAAAAAWSNELAETVSRREWSPAMSADALRALAGASTGFTDAAVPIAERELRAERLVLGLDRLLKAVHGTPSPPGAVELAGLFDQVQDRDQFDPQSFCAQLRKFDHALTR
jgi:hypothetical protein